MSKSKTGDDLRDKSRDELENEVRQLRAMVGTRLLAQHTGATSGTLMTTRRVYSDVEIEAIRVAERLRVWDISRDQLEKRWTLQYNYSRLFDHVNYVIGVVVAASFAPNAKSIMLQTLQGQSGTLAKLWRTMRELAAQSAGYDLSDYEGFFLTLISLVGDVAEGKPIDDLQAFVAEHGSETLQAMHAAAIEQNRGGRDMVHSPLTDEIMRRKTHNPKLKVPDIMRRIKYELEQLEKAGTMTPAQVEALADYRVLEQGADPFDAMNKRLKRRDDAHDMSALVPLLP